MYILKNEDFDLGEQSRYTLIFVMQFDRSILFDSQILS